MEAKAKKMKTDTGEAAPSAPTKTSAAPAAMDTEVSVVVGPPALPVNAQLASMQNTLDQQLLADLDGIALPRRRICPTCSRVAPCRTSRLGRAPT